MTEPLLEKIKQLPDQSGVYLMKNRRGEIIYVGKATSLKKRVSSYFQGKGFSPKVQALVSHIVAIDYIPTRSEKAALLLEFELIKRYRPRYNVMYRDDKSYPYLKITMKEQWPRLMVTRIVRKDGAKYYGPYPDGSHLRRIVRAVRKYFPLRYCRQTNIPVKSCLYFHLKRCAAPCLGKVSREQYLRMLREVDLFLRNRPRQLLQYLDQQLANYSQTMEYEQAQRVYQEKQFIEEILAHINFRQVDPTALLQSHLPELPQQQMLPLLQKELGLPCLPRRIEAFDISNISGQLAVGSMVTFINGKPAQQEYRRFRIKSISGIDDYAMLGEVLHRRYSYLAECQAKRPDLILIDGGKGQLSQAVSKLRELDEQIPLASIAKREEKIFLPGQADPLALDRRSPALQLVRHIRDEAHRFAISYHRLLRRKTLKEKG
ncbi:MAG: excinuclease ABC subunit UvrC [bacterium]|nr:excinuclease ABC subunit UvrC [bacterium]MDD5756867.1 excinuclease ABC subunit UvrC [bacterium]